MFVTTTMAHEEGTDPADLELARLWFMAAGQKEVNKTGSEVALEAQVVMEAHEGFNEWCERIVCGNLGNPAPQTPPQAQPQQQQQHSNRGDIHLLATLLANNQAGRAAEKANAAEKQTRESYTKFKVLWQGNFWTPSRPRCTEKC